nr:uncharacterized protein CFP56_06472 [Quercus suber]
MEHSHLKLKKKESNLHGELALPFESNGYIRVDCYDGLNQMRRDFEVAAYWNESSGFADVFDVDYFLQQMNEFIKVVKELPPEIASKEPFRVDCSKRKGQFDYIESVLPSLLEHHYISITPARSQRRDRRAFAEFTSQGFSGRDLMQALWKAHLEDYVMGRGSALPDYFCEFKL